MEWMSVSQAATALGVSERTIYNHVKAKKLETRRHDGKFEVLTKPSEQIQDTVGNLSKVVAAEVAMKRTSFEALLKITESMQHQLETFDGVQRSVEREFSRLHWSRRVAWLGMVLLACACGAGAWFYHVAELRHHQGLVEHQTEIADLRIASAREEAEMRGRLVAIEQQLGHEHKLFQETSALMLDLAAEITLSDHARELALHERKKLEHQLHQAKLELALKQAGTSWLDLLFGPSLAHSSDSSPAQEEPPR